MRRHPSRFPLVLCLSLAACVEAEPPLELAPGFDEHTYGELRVHLRAPGGGSACAGLPDGTEFGVGMADASSSSSYSSFSVICPDNVAVFNAEFGHEYELFVETTYADVPWAGLTVLPDTIVISSDTAIALRLAYGREVGGRAFLNGEPIDGRYMMQLDAASRFLTSISTGSAHSDAAEGWLDQRGGTPFLAQPNVAYYRICQADLGMRIGSAPDPTVAAYFPTDFRKVDCRFRTSNAARFTHASTDLQITAAAGQIYPWHGDDEQGYGFPVTYPTGGALAWGHSMIEESMLVWGEELSGSIRSAWDRSSAVGCFSSDPMDCPFIVQTSGPRVDADAGGRVVRFMMTDSGVVSRSMTVAQSSRDGAYGDYVLYKFMFTNNGPSQTIYPAWYTEWAIGGEDASNRANTSLRGRLLYATDGTHWLGTYMMRADVSAIYAAECCGMGGPEADGEFARDVLTGDIVSTRTEWHEGVSTTHGVELTIPSGQTRSFWMAVVAGGSLAELEFNAGQARNEVIAHESGTFTE